MDTQKQVKIQRLESLEDLELLIRGDAVEIVYENMPLWKYGSENELGAYHGMSHSNQFQFLIPMMSNGEYLVMYRARRSQIQVRDGKVILNEDKSVTESFSPRQSEYVELNNTLVMAGLR
jgi:hypothetical protein